jgi:anti-anti-sigma factor
MEIIHADYQVAYDATTATVICQGAFRLRGSEEYAPISQLLTEAADAKPPTLILDLRALEFLNSSGINTLAKFVLQVRRHNVSQIVIKGSSQFPWQEKSLRNFQRLLPALQLEIE